MKHLVWANLDFRDSAARVMDSFCSKTIPAIQYDQCDANQFQKTFERFDVDAFCASATSAAMTKKAFVVALVGDGSFQQLFSCVCDHESESGDSTNETITTKC